MLRKRVIPVLLLQNGGLVKTVRFKDPFYIGDPINAIKIFNDKEVDELIFLDITATFEQRKPDFEYIEKIASECFMPLCYGGGITTLSDIKKIIGSGIEKIAINTAASENPELVRSAADLYGSSAIVVSIDIKKSILGKYSVYTGGGKKNINIDPVKWAVKMQELGAGEILLNSIDRDGVMNGYDTSIIYKVADAIDIPLIACGGAGNIEHLNEAIKAKASAAAAGSIFVFKGKHRAVLINFPDDKELVEKLN